MGQNQSLMRFLIGGSIAFLLLSLVACSSSNPASPSCPSGKNFLAYPGSSLDYSGQSGGFIVSEYTSSDSVGKIYSFYINSLAGAGWKVRLTQNLTQTANLSILCSKNPSMGGQIAIQPPSSTSKSNGINVFLLTQATSPATAGFPHDLPIYPQASWQGGELRAEAVFGYWTIKGNVNDVVAWYKSQLISPTWQVSPPESSIPTDSNATTIAFSRTISPVFLGSIIIEPDPSNPSYVAIGAITPVGF